MHLCAKKSLYTTSDIAELESSPAASLVSGKLSSNLFSSFTLKLSNLSASLIILQCSSSNSFNPSSILYLL